MESCRVNRPARSRRRLVSGAPPDTGADHPAEAAQVVGRSGGGRPVELGQQRDGEGVPDDRQLLHPLLLHRAPERGRVERARGRVTTRPAAQQVAEAKKKPVPCISGEAGRTTGAVPDATCPAAAATTSARSRGTGSPARRKAEETTPHTPAALPDDALGRPVVPPVSSSTWSSARPLLPGHRGRRRQRVLVPGGVGRLAARDHEARSPGTRSATAPVTPARLASATSARTRRTRRPARARSPGSGS